MTENQEVCIAGAQVLVVDDTPANIGVLSKMLEDQGYKVLVATSGESALKIAQRAAPDLILLDVMMPGIDGLETCRRLKAHELSRDIPVIFVTALSELANIVEGFRVGAVDYIQKPFRHEEVCARVGTHLTLRRYLERHRRDAEHLRAIVNNMAEGLLLLDGQGRVHSANPAAHHLLGYPPGQLDGRGLAELLDERDARDCLNFLSSAGSQSLPQLRHGPQEVQMRTQSHQALAVDLTLTQIFAGDTRYVALLHDISAHKQAHAEALRVAHVDPLTNIANRRHFDSFLQEQWHRAQRNGLPLALVLVDVDCFKLYNDSLGHQAGDACLQQVAQALRSCAKRPTDLAARVGGEEFALLLSDTDGPGAVKLAEGARLAVSQLEIPHPRSPAGPHVSISLGVACLIPGRELDPARLFALADAALYRAKETGRNRVHCE